MIQRDFIQRMIEQISQVLALLMGMNVPQDKLDLIRDAYRKWLRTNPEFLLSLSPENIVEVLTEEEGYSVEHLEFLAEMIGEEGKAHLELKNENAAKDCLKKSLVLFDYVNENQQLYSIERMIKMKDLKDKWSTIQ